MWIYLNKIKREGKHLKQSEVEKLARDVQRFVKDTLKISVNVGIVGLKKK